MNIPGIRSYPDIFRFQTEEWNVRFVRAFPDCKDQVAECDPSTKTITIRLGQGPHGSLTSLFHEVLHGYEEELGIIIPHSAIYFCSEAFADFIISNNIQFKFQKDTQ